MLKGSNCDRKSQFSEILTELLNPRATYITNLVYEIQLATSENLT